MKNLKTGLSAHMIVPSAGLAHSLPIHLRSWLERWAAIRQIEVAAVAIKNELAWVTYTVTLILRPARRCPYWYFSFPSALKELKGWGVETGKNLGTKK
jgi:hypothetical protein